MASKRRRELNRMQRDREIATEITADEFDERAPLFGFEKSHEITRDGQVFNIKLNRFIKHTYEPNRGSKYISITVDGEKHNISVWRAVFDSYLDEDEKDELGLLIEKIPPFILEDAHNIFNKAHRYLVPYINQFDLPLYIFESYLMSNHTERPLIDIKDERKFRYIELGCDDLQYILNYDCGKYKVLHSTKEVADSLGLGTIRTANRLLVEWNIQEKLEGGGYTSTLDYDCYDSEGFYMKLVWTLKGMKVIYDKAVELGHIEGDDERFIELIKKETSLFDF